MPHRLHVFLLTGIVSVLALGCNSHASFPDNNGNNVNNVNNQDCGNGSLDPGEVCDLDQEGHPLIKEGEACEGHGYAGGDLGCDQSNCQLVTSGCIPLEGCDPVDDYGCELNNCFYFPESDQASCHDPAFKTEGESCDWPPDCSPRHTCFEGFCRRVCAPGSTCPNGVDVCIEMGWYEGTLGVCPLPSGPCDPKNGTGCPDNEACYLDRENLEGYCAFQGGAGLDQECSDDTDCLGGLVCLQLETEGFGKCVPLCDSTFQICPEGSSWCAYSSGGTIGFCTENDGCDPIDGNGCDFAQQYCTITNPYGSFSCLVPGPVGENEFCDLFNLCDRGLFCAVEYDFKCHRPCDDLADCSGSDTCHEMPGWIGLSGWTGYCRLP